MTAPPPRLVLVPALPTATMFCAGDEAIIAALNEHPQDPQMAHGTPAERCYAAMLSSAPEAPSEEMVERGAIAAITYGASSTVWPVYATESARKLWRETIRAAFAALLAGPR